MQKSAYASPPRASFLVSDLWRFVDPATQPQGAFPHRQRAGCPRVALARVNQHAAGQTAATHSHCSDRLGSLHRDSVKVRRQSRFRIKAMPVAQTRPAPGLARPRPERFPRVIGSNGQTPFFVPPSRLYLRGSRTTRSKLLRSSLSRCGLISLGFSKKILRRLRGFIEVALQHL